MQSILADVPLSDFVRPGRVRRQAYNDPAIFELEMERIFGRAWVYVGHESQVRNVGDFVRTRIGRTPLVMTRHEDGQIYVLRNQCAHRGVMVVACDAGNAKEFQCFYHGWLYGNDGRLKALPLRNGYPASFDPNDPDTAMKPVPRLANYRGFLFASLAADGPSLTEFLGPITRSFDDMVDRSPTGEIEMAGGVFKHGFDANWKVYLENLVDVAHPLFVHQSSIEAARAQSDQAFSDGSGEIAIRQMRQNGAPYSFWEANVGIWTYPNGHCFVGDYHDDTKLVAALNDETFRQYRDAMVAHYGAARTDEILAEKRWNSNVWPNFSFMSQFQQIRVVHPIAVDRTVVHTYTFRLKGAPEEMMRKTVSFANTVNGTGSLVLTDDLETYDRIDCGLKSEGAEWLQIGRGFTSDVDEGEGSRRGANSTSEIALRNMWDAWTQHMTAPEPAGQRLGAPVLTAAE